MSAMKIKKGDTVRVIAGKDKVKEGKVSSVDEKNNKVTVEGVNMRYKAHKTKCSEPEWWHCNTGRTQLMLQM